MKRLAVAVFALAAVACGVDSNTNSTGVQQSALTAEGSRLDLSVSASDWSTLQQFAANPPAPPMQGSGFHQGPPQELIDACATATSGASCSATIDGHSISGTCASP